MGQRKAAKTRGSARQVQVGDQAPAVIRPVRPGKVWLRRKPGRLDAKRILKGEPGRAQFPPWAAGSEQIRQQTHKASPVPDFPARNLRSDSRHLPAAPWCSERREKECPRLFPQ